MNSFAIVANEPSGLVAFKVGFGGCAAPRPFFASATNAVINQDERVPTGAPVLDAFFSEHKTNFISRRPLPLPSPPTDRKIDVEGKGVSGLVDLGGRRLLK